MKNMALVQRQIALRVIRGYRTISLGSIWLLAEMAPIWLLDRLLSASSSNVNAMDNYYGSIKLKKLEDSFNCDQESCRV